MSSLPSSFSAFLAGCRTFDPGAPEPRPVPAGWPYLEQLVAAMETTDRLIVVKSRQMMVTWIGCAWLLYRALTAGPGMHVVLSKEERSAKELIERMRFLLDHLPEGWTEGRTIKSTGTTIAITDLDSRLVSLPAAPHAVRGLSPRTVFWDEMAFTPADDAIWTAVKPAVDSGGSFLGVSTPNGPNGIFYRLAHDDSGRFTVHRVHYHDHPERDGDWEQSARAGLSEERWRREQELSFEGAEGRVYDQFSRKTHVRKRDFTPGRARGSRLFRGIDFGYRRPAAVWAEERADGKLIVFHALLGDRWPLDLFHRKVREIDASYGLSERDFTWTGVDPAGQATDDFGLSPIHELQQAGMKLRWRSSRINWGIEAVRSLLLDAAGTVSLTVHERCDVLVQAFEGYMWDSHGEEAVKDGEHDHLMDALRYLVINLPRYQRPGRSPSPRITGIAPFPPRP